MHRELIEMVAVEEQEQWWTIQTASLNDSWEVSLGGPIEVRPSLAASGNSAHPRRVAPLKAPTAVHDSHRIACLPRDSGDVLEALPIACRVSAWSDLLKQVIFTGGAL